MDTSQLKSPPVKATMTGADQTARRQGQHRWKQHLDLGQLGDIWAGLAGEGTASGDNKLYGVADDDGVIDQVTVVEVL